MAEIIRPALDLRHGQRLTEIRKHRGMSQGLLAAIIGVAVGSIQNWERGRAHMSTERIEQLAHALQCEPADLLAPAGSAMPKFRFKESSVWSDAQDIALQMLALQMKAAGLNREEALSVAREVQHKMVVYYDLKKQGVEHGEIMARLFPEFRQ